MKKYFFTSPNFMGEARALYDDKGMLLHIDFQACSMTPAQISYFKEHLPVEIIGKDTLGNAFAKARLVIVEESYRVTFDDFWTEYGIKRNRQRCEKLWAKLSQADQARAHFGLRAYTRYLALNNWRTKADPDTYLRNRYWENEWK